MRSATRGLIACDLDGTALDSQKVLRSRTLDALNAARQAGWVTACASARPLRMICSADGRTLRGFDYLVASNGAFVVDDISLRVVRAATLPLEDCALVIERARALIGDVGFGWETGQSFECDLRLRSLFEERRILRDCPTALLREGPDSPPHQLVVAGGAGSVDEWRSVLLSVTDRVAVTESGGGVVEISSLRATKVAAVRSLAHRLRVRMQNVIAFGDGINDLELLSHAGTSIAMGNADPRVKVGAQVVTCTNDEDGVARFLEAMLAETS